jgi:hypothetical protein
MTQQLSMNQIIHAAFRRDLQRFEDALATFPPGSQPRADQLWGAWENVAFQLHHHHSDEETIFWPTLRELGADATLVDTLAGEHERMLAALATAETAMAAFHGDPSAANAAAARASIGELRTVLVDHLAHEERDLEPISNSHHDTPQMKAAVRAVRKAHKGGAGTFFSWLSDSDDPEVASSLRGELPAPVLLMLTRFAGRDYNRRIASVWA